MIELNPLTIFLMVIAVLSISLNIAQALGYRDMLTIDLVIRLLDIGASGGLLVAKQTATPDDDKVWSDLRELLARANGAPLSPEPVIEPSTETVAKASNEAILTGEFTRSDAPHPA